MVYLFISWLLINSVHGYGIYENRKKPFHTISENLASIPSLLLIYRIAHVINGLLLFLIVSIAVDSGMHWGVLTLTAASILFEWAQAAVPYLNKWKVIHNFFAICMATSMIGLGWSLFAHSDLYGAKASIALFAGSIALLSFAYVKHPPRPRSWVVQMITINSLYLQILMIFLV